MTRRDFLKCLGIGAGTTIVGTFLPGCTGADPKKAGDTIKSTTNQVAKSLEQDPKNKFLNEMKSFLSTRSYNNEYFTSGIQYINEYAKKLGLPNIDEFRIKNPQEDLGIKEMEKIEESGGNPFYSSDRIAFSLYCIKELGVLPEVSPNKSTGVFIEITGKEVIDFSQYKPLTDFDPQAKGKRNLYYIKSFGDNITGGSTLSDGTMIVAMEERMNPDIAKANEIGNAYSNMVLDLNVKNITRNVRGLQIPTNTISFNEALSDCISLQKGLNENNADEIIRLVEYVAGSTRGEVITGDNRYYLVSINLMGFSLADAGSSKNLSIEDLEELNMHLNNTITPMITKSNFNKNIGELKIYLERNPKIIKEIVQCFHNNYRTTVAHLTKKKK